jgi:hypothetical protein
MIEHDNTVGSLLKSLDELGIAEATHLRKICTCIGNQQGMTKSLVSTKPVFS